MSLSSPDILVLRYLRRLPAGAMVAQISAACGLAPSAIRERMEALQDLGLVTDDGTSRRVYVVTAEGWRRAKINDARRTST